MKHRLLNTLLRLLTTKSRLAILSWALSLTTIPLVHANMQVSLAEPNWQFLLDSRPVELTSAKLEAGEDVFSRRLKPLLNAKKYTEAAALFSAREMQHDSAALRQLRGQVLLSLKRLDDAEQALNAAIELMPNLAIAHRSLSMLYMLKKDYNKASQHLTRSIELGVADAQLYGQLAFINLNNHHAASAIIGYQQALYLQPSNSQWQQGLLYAWLNSHNFSAAHKLVEDMLDQGQHPNPMELWLLRSQIALQMEQPKQALTSIEVALHLPSSNTQDKGAIAQQTRNKILAAKLHVQHGSVQRAVDLLASSLKSFPAASTHQTRADKTAHPAQKELLTALEQILPWLFNKEEDSKVAQLLTVTESIHIPRRFAAKMNMYRGQLALQQDNTKQAIQQLRNALKQDPTLGAALLSLAKAYKKQRQFAQAERYYVRASAIPQIKVRALLGNAQLQIEQKIYPQALNLLLQAIKVAPHRQDIRNNVQALQTIIKQEQYES